MAIAGDSYIISLEKAHLEWGTHRYTDSRGVVFGEGYIPIPSDAAYRLNLLNNNGTGNRDVLGLNLFRCVSADGIFSGVLRAQGNQNDTKYAKQFAGDKHLKALGDWFHAIGASVGDRVEVRWTNSTDFVIRKL